MIVADHRYSAPPRIPDPLDLPLGIEQEAGARFRRSIGNGEGIFDRCGAADEEAANLGIARRLRLVPEPFQQRP